jgi:hypothetical protein
MTGASDPFASLAETPRWVAWRVERPAGRGKPTKIPYAPLTGKRASVTDAATWGTRTDAVRRDQIASPLGAHGVGIVLGPCDEDGTVLCGADIDSCRSPGRDGITDWAEGILAAASATYAEISPSGTGIKVFFRISEAEVGGFLEKIGVNGGARGCRRSIRGEGGGDHGPAIEVYTGARYFAVTGEEWPAAGERQIAVLDEATLRRLADEITKVALPPGGGKDAGGRKDGKGASAADDSRSAKVFRLARKMRVGGQTLEEFRAAIKADPELAGWYDEKGRLYEERELKRAWEKEEAEATGGLRLAHFAPWGEAVDGAALLDEITETVRKFVVAAGDDVAAVALWIVAAHAFERFALFPRLFVSAPVENCGKTTALDVIGKMTPKAIHVSQITAASLFRTIGAARPTLLLDEADTYLRQDGDLRAVVNAGHRRDGSVIRCVGDHFTPTQFGVFCPMTLAAIGKLHRTIMSRSIVIELKRKRADERVLSLRLGRDYGFERLGRMAARWAVDNGEALAGADPEMPRGIDNRTADNWAPLLAVADAVGGRWPQSARSAALAIEGHVGAGGGLGMMILRDLRSLFEMSSEEVLFTTDEILPALTGDKEKSEWAVEFEDRQWREFKDGKALSAYQLAGLLREFAIEPGTHRRRDQRGKGYRRAAFEDVWKRYL